jgi:hypothetical protein
MPLLPWKKLPLTTLILCLQQRQACEWQHGWLQSWFLCEAKAFIFGMQAFLGDGTLGTPPPLYCVTTPFSTTHPPYTAIHPLHMLNLLYRWLCCAKWVQNLAARGAGGGTEAWHATAAPKAAQTKPFIAQEHIHTCDTAVCRPYASLGPVLWIAGHMGGRLRLWLPARQPQRERVHDTLSRVCRSLYCWSKGERMAASGYSGAEPSDSLGQPGENASPPSSCNTNAGAGIACVEGCGVDGAADRVRTGRSSSPLEAGDPSRPRLLVCAGVARPALVAAADTAAGSSASAPRACWRAFRTTALRSGDSSSSPWLPPGVRASWRAPAIAEQLGSTVASLLISKRDAGRAPAALDELLRLPAASSSSTAAADPSLPTRPSPAWLE